MGPLMKVTNGRWIQPEHVVRVTPNGHDGSSIIHFVDDHSITVGEPVRELVDRINEALHRV